MNKLFLPMFAVALLCASASSALVASSHSNQPAPSSAATKTTDATRPSYDLKAQALLDLDDMHKKFVDLANAIPQEKFTWRPADGVRSVSEVFLHVSAANYLILNMMGTPIPASVDAKNLEKSTTDKTQVVDRLNKSFADARAAVDAMSNADFAKLLPKLGPDANCGDVVYTLVTHAHEHMGQSIAYARENGIVPPWTAAAAQKAGQPQE